MVKYIICIRLVQSIYANPLALRAAPFTKGAVRSPPLSKEGQGGFRQSIF